MKTIVKPEVEVDKNRVCQRLGYKDHAPPPRFLSLIDDQVALAKRLIEPVYAYELRTIKRVKSPELEIEDELVFTSCTVSYALADCKWAAIYVATVGQQLSDEVTRLTREGKTLEGLTLDAIGSEAVIQAARHLQNTVKEMARAKNCQATIKYSPGYCDWDIKEQKTLLAALESEFIGVSLTESCLMIPLKSVSGIIGIGSLEKKRLPPCLAVCQKRDKCTNKRTEWDPEVKQLL